MGKMKYLGLLVDVMGHLNQISSIVFIEYYDEGTGQITLSNKTELNINELSGVKDIESYIGPEAAIQ
jgi:hypothetical protein